MAIDYYPGGPAQSDDGGPMSFLGKLVSGIGTVVGGAAALANPVAGGLIAAGTSGLGTAMQGGDLEDVAGAALMSGGVAAGTGATKLFFANAAKAQVFEDSLKTLATSATRGAVQGGAAATAAAKGAASSVGASLPSYAAMRAPSDLNRYLGNRKTPREGSSDSANGKWY